MKNRFLFLSRRRGRIGEDNKKKKDFVEIAKEIIRISDLLLLILDARYIKQTRNPEIEEEIKKADKKLIYVINKADLADIEEALKEIAKEEIKPYVLFSCKNKIGRKELRKLIKIEIKRLKLKNRRFKKVHIGVIGYPNSGKSSLINILSRKGAAGISRIAGFTRGIQKIRFMRNVYLFDSPGILTKKEMPEKSEIFLKKQAEIGIVDYNKVKNPDMVVYQIMKKYPKVIEKYYNIPIQEDAELVLMEIGKRFFFLRKGGEIDIDRTARKILKDWQEGKIGNYK